MTTAADILKVFVHDTYVRVYMLRLVCIAGIHTGFYVFPSRAEMAYKLESKGKTPMLFLDQTFDVLSNSAFDFAVHLISCTGKCCACIQPQRIGVNFQENQVYTIRKSV